MNKIFFLLLILIICSVFTSYSQIEKILGRWVAIDNKNPADKSVIHIHKGNDNKYYGRVEKVFGNQNVVCEKCKGENKNKPILGLLIINDMELKDSVLTGGTILDPTKGDTYYCSSISYDKKSNKLKIRGSLDKRGWFGYTQFWEREK